MKDVMGIIYTGENDARLRELTIIRAIAALPVAGRFRVIDFLVSSMVNGGMKNIGGPYGEEGLHGRAANIPAKNVCVNAQWVGDDYIMEVSGTMRESSVFGINIVWKRTIRTKLFSDYFTLEDTLINESFDTENIALCYHCNFGYPLVCEEAKIVGVPDKENKMDRVNGIIILIVYSLFLLYLTFYR